MVGMVKQCVLAEVFLELAKQASRKTGLLLEVYVVEAPLVLKEWCANVGRRGMPRCPGSPCSLSHFVRPKMLGTVRNVRKYRALLG